MSTPNALIAVQRFGLGAEPGQLARLAGDPQRWVRDQIGRGAPLLAGIQPSAERVVELTEALKDKRRMKAESEQDANGFSRLKVRQRDLYLGDVETRHQAAISSDASFAERWVRFWSNHFTVSITRLLIAGLVVPFENEAIRPYAFGHFTDLVLAVVRHPAMLLYLDNAQSVGPDSLLGRRKEAGLNENLARELMELHTLGVGGGYSQDDVRALAMILTGWSIVRPGRMARYLDAAPGTFEFVAIAHEPGDKVLLGKRCREQGESEGLAAIRDLCAHPATARHIAGKIARHFLADDPPPAAVAALAETFTASGGDLASVARRLISLPESWSLPMTKARPPEEWLIAVQRAAATDKALPGAKIVAALQQLGQMPFAAPSPAGWTDDSAGWLGPEALMARLDFANVAAKRARAARPQAVAEQIFGPALSEESRLQIERAPSVVDALALLLVSPEFMLR
jgi:uncharacterized protein (DUF1800 family)